MSEGHVAFEYESQNLSPETLATLGEGHIAYVKQIRSEDVPGLFPEAPKIAPGLKLFALHAADGTPIMLTDSHEAAPAFILGDESSAVVIARSTCDEAIQNPSAERFWIASLRSQ